MDNSDRGPTQRGGCLALARWMLTTHTEVEREPREGEDEKIITWYHDYHFSQFELLHRLSKLSQ